MSEDRKGWELKEDRVGKRSASWFEKHWFDLSLKLWQWPRLKSGFTLFWGGGNGAALETGKLVSARLAGLYWRWKYRERERERVSPDADSAIGRTVVTSGCIWNTIRDWIKDKRFLLVESPLRPAIPPWIYTEGFNLIETSTKN